MHVPSTITDWNKLPENIINSTSLDSFIYGAESDYCLTPNEQFVSYIMGRTRYICYHGENKIHLLSWGEQDTFVIMDLVLPMKTNVSCSPHGNTCILFSP
jgi:hypothetical protein